MNTGNLDTYFDFKGLGELKAQSNRADRDEAVAKVAKQFEAYFIGEMLKSMRLASESFKSDLIDSRSMDTYQEMFDQQISVSLSERGALGLQPVLQQAMDRMRPRSASSGFGTQFFQLDSVSEPKKIEERTRQRFDLTSEVLRFRGNGP